MGYVGAGRKYSVIPMVRLRRPEDITIGTLIIASIFGSKVDLQVLDPVFLVNGVRWCCRNTIQKALFSGTAF